MLSALASIKVGRAKAKSYLTPEQFKDFLNSEQRDPRLNEILHPYADCEKARAIIEQFETNSSLRKEGGWLLLFRYMEEL